MKQENTNESLPGAFHCTVWAGFKGLSSASSFPFGKKCPSCDKSTQLVLGQAHRGHTQGSTPGMAAGKIPPVSQQQSREHGVGQGAQHPRPSSR